MGRARPYSELSMPLNPYSTIPNIVNNDSLRQGSV